jgi:hypothetical protein
MDRAEELRHLPLAHAVALRMHDAGADEAMIAALAIEPDSVGSLLELARAKAERIARRAGSSGASEDHSTESS